MTHQKGSMINKLATITDIITRTYVKSMMNPPDHEINHT